MRSYYAFDLVASLVFSLWKVFKMYFDIDYNVLRFIEIFLDIPRCVLYLENAFTMYLEKSDRLIIYNEGSVK